MLLQLSYRFENFQNKRVGEKSIISSRAQGNMQHYCLLMWRTENCPHVQRNVYLLDELFHSNEKECSSFYSSGI